MPGFTSIRRDDSSRRCRSNESARTNITLIHRLGGLASCFALASLAACPAAVVAGTDTTIVDSVQTFTTGDTTYIGDFLTYQLPLYLDKTNTAIAGIDVTVANDRPDVISVIDPPTTSGNPSPYFNVQALALGTATITFTPSGTHFTNGVPQVRAYHVVVAPQPTAIEMPSSVFLTVGQSVVVEALVKGGTNGPRITRGTYDWSTPDAVTGFGSGGAATSHGTDGVDAVILYGKSAGTTSITVSYAGPGNVTLSRTIDVFVVPSGTSHVVFDRGLSVTTASATFLLTARAQLFGPSGALSDPRAIHLVSRDPSIFTVNDADCVDPQIDPTACNTGVQVNKAAILQRPGHVASAWIVATAGPAQADSLLYTAYAEIASLDLAPGDITMSLGTTRDFVVTPKDALGVAIPVAAFASFGIADTFTAPPGMAHIVEQIVNFQTTLHYTVFADSVDDTGHATATLKFTMYNFPVSPNIDSPTSTITINAVDHVNVVPFGGIGATIDVGATHPYVATAVDGAGRTVTLPLATTWRSSNNAVASVSPAGIVTGNTTGTATILASIGGVEGGVVVTVQPPPPGPATGIRITPTNPTVTANSTIPYLVYLVDAQTQRTPPVGGSLGCATTDSNIADVVSATYDPAQVALVCVVKAKISGQTVVTGFLQVGPTSTFSVGTNIIVP